MQSKLIIFLLTIATLCIWLAVLALPDKNLHIVACDVGQGDAILAYTGTTQILFDGGPNGKVVECLNRYMPFWDREVEMVVLSHPQTDHFRGLIDVVEDFKVDYFLANSLNSDTRDYQVLKNLVGGSVIQVINPTSGMDIGLGMIHLDILWPSGKFLAENYAQVSTNSQNNVLGINTSKLDPNDFSVVAVLSFRDFDALFTGDISPEEEHRIIESGLTKQVEYIKVPHHGSKNGLTKEFLDAANPEVAVISVGKNNSYGHPNKEVLEMLLGENVKTLRTDEMGDVVVSTDGSNVWINKD